MVHLRLRRLLEGELDELPESRLLSDPWESLILSLGLMSLMSFELMQRSKKKVFLSVIMKMKHQRNLAFIVSHLGDNIAYSKTQT